MHERGHASGVLLVLTDSLPIFDSFSGEVRWADQEVRGEVRFFDYNMPVNMPAPEQ